MPRRGCNGPTVVIERIDGKTVRFKVRKEEICYMKSTTIKFWIIYCLVVCWNVTYLNPWDYKSENKFDFRMIENSYHSRFLAPKTIQSLEAMDESSDTESLWSAIINQ